MFDENVSRLIAQYRHKGALIDTNLLLLLVVGDYLPSRISSFKRTAAYSQHDYALLKLLASKFEVRWTTPNILTEVDNLGRQLKVDEYAGLARSVHRIATSTIEVTRSSRQVSALPYFSQFGLSDTVSILLSEDCLVISDDLRLCSYVLHKGRDAINFNHLRL